MDSNMGMNQSLIYAEGCTNVGLCGEGMIDGRGTKANFPGLETIGATPGRPFLIRIIDCQQRPYQGPLPQGLTVLDAELSALR